MNHSNLRLNEKVEKGMNTTHEIKVYASIDISNVLTLMQLMPGTSWPRMTSVMRPQCEAQRVDLPIYARSY